MKKEYKYMKEQMETILKRSKTVQGFKEVDEIPYKEGYAIHDINGITYSVIRVNNETGHHNYRHYDNKQGVIQHLINLGYTEDYTRRIMEENKFPRKVPTNNRDVYYTINEVKDDMVDILDSVDKLWVIDTDALLGDKKSDRFMYFIDQDKIIYRRTVSTGNTKAITHKGGRSVRIGTTYSIKIQSIWDKYRGERFELWERTQNTQ